MSRDDGRGVDPDWTAALRARVADESVSDLAARLDSDDPEERAGAAWRLVEAAARKPAAVRSELDAVVDCLDDPDVWVRRGATWVLAELADAQPDALSVHFSALLGMLEADDPMVVQNGVVAVAAVAEAYPSRATSGLSALASLTDSADALVRRYARQAVRDVSAALAERADDAGYPMVVHAHETYADLLPKDATVVVVNDDEERTRPVQVSFGEDAPVEREATAGEVPERGPPEEVPDAPSVSLAQADLDVGRRVGASELTTRYRATVDESVLEHGVVTFHTLATSDSRVAEAFREALDRWASVDDHDHVTTLLGQGSRWFATRFEGGEALADDETLAERDAPRTLGEAVWDAQAVTRAVSHAHGRGVVHGGLHPGAVRYVGTPTGVWDAPTVSEWGFAHAVSGERVPPVPAAFAAPEHRDPQSYGAFDQSTDVFGLGALTYTLLTGVPPAGGADERVPATELSDALPASADDLFARALAPEKPARFATVLDFQRALDAFAAEVD